MSYSSPVLTSSPLSAGRWLQPLTSLAATEGALFSTLPPSTRYPVQAYSATYILNIIYWILYHGKRDAIRYVYCLYVIIYPCRSM